MNELILTYDKSNEDIPTLVVGRKDGYSLFGDTRIRIEKVITGQKAEDIWEDLTGEKGRKAAFEAAIKKQYESCMACTDGTEEACTQPGPEIAPVFKKLNEED